MNKSIGIFFLLFFLLTLPSVAAMHSSALALGHSSGSSTSATNMAEKQFAENVKYTLVLNNNTLLRGNSLPSESGGRDLRFDLGVDSFNGEIYASALDWRYFGQSGLLVLSAKTGPTYSEAAPLSRPWQVRIQRMADSSDPPLQ